MEDEGESEIAGWRCEITAKKKASNRASPAAKVGLCAEIVSLWEDIVGEGPTAERRQALAEARVGLAEAKVGVAEAKVDVAEDELRAAEANNGDVAEAELRVAEAEVRIAKAKVGVAEAKMGVAEASGQERKISRADGQVHAATEAHCMALAELGRVQASQSREQAGAAGATTEAPASPPARGLLAAEGQARDFYALYEAYYWSHESNTDSQVDPSMIAEVCVWSPFSVSEDEDEHQWEAAATRLNECIDATRRGRRANYPPPDRNLIDCARDVTALSAADVVAVGRAAQMRVSMSGGQEARVIAPCTEMLQTMFPSQRFAPEFNPQIMKFVRSATGKHIDWAVCVEHGQGGSRVCVPLVLLEYKAVDGDLNKDLRRLRALLLAAVREVVARAAAQQQEVLDELAIFGVLVTEGQTRLFVARPARWRDINNNNTFPCAVVIEDLGVLGQGVVGFANQLHRVRNRALQSAARIVTVLSLSHSVPRVADEHKVDVGATAPSQPPRPYSQQQGGQQLQKNATKSRRGRHDAGAHLARQRALAWPELSRCGKLLLVSKTDRVFTDFTPAPSGDVEPEWRTRVWHAEGGDLAVVAKVGGQGRRELEARARLQHGIDGLVPLLRQTTFPDVVHPAQVVTVMLFPWLRSRGNAPDVFRRANWRALLRGMLRGLLSLHSSGVAHLDVKPDNVLALPASDLNPDEVEVLLIDLGCALKLSRHGEEPNGCGTPGYRAPEVHRADERWYRGHGRCCDEHAHDRFDLAADLFSAGVTLESFVDWRGDPPPAVAFDDLSSSCPGLAQVLGCLTHPCAYARGTAKSWLRLLSPPPTAREESRRPLGVHNAQQRRQVGKPTTAIRVAKGPENVRGL